MRGLPLLGKTHEQMLSEKYLDFYNSQSYENLYVKSIEEHKWSQKSLNML